jgi:ABC-2 type transport system permease protein
MNRFLAVFRKSLLEQVRSGWELALILLTIPAFVMVYWLFFGGGSTSYSLLVINQDSGPHGERLTQAIAGLAYPDGKPILRVKPATDRAAAETLLRNRDAAALVVIPPNFSTRLERFRDSGARVEGDPLVFSGDLTNPIYAVAAVLASGVVEDYQREVTGQPRPVAVAEEPLGGSATRSEFETYVPGLLVVAVVMMLFTAATRVASEIERGGVRRLALTQVTSLEYLAGVSAVQMLVGSAAVLLAFVTAFALGFRSQGPLWLAVLIGATSAFSVIGVGLIVAAISKTTGQAFIIANFPMVLMMFFSGGVFPVQRIPLFTLGGRTFALFDILPQTHAVLALNKVLTLGAGPGEVAYELSMVVLLSTLYFLVGVFVFDRKVFRNGD